jgi:hypothetical protein
VCVCVSVCEWRKDAGVMEVGCIIMRECVCVSVCVCLEEAVIFCVNDVGVMKVRTLLQCSRNTPVHLRNTPEHLWNTRVTLGRFLVRSVVLRTHMTLL